ncbi:MAG: hypothetical protein A2836_00700 [Candidatus Taylorbacteria bacterium RIFCSPHIGHO2_01_FULL_45_63]|uniref:Amidohydrolase-related domain-containing protein n=1 Tax=Candidatus Taylorbacteria bacterium RIFCSPHIGHO2_02_FULL_45_35 TaxID=1802311 RepID=A0A1G2MTE3_9BACT|nr:MAG: hypothetical protein A2836_00700 [Candidatus Taylorbacteria bacterium RIFCSPHIGHO2_01_FULL_45_63]OHA27138.1 MAG: hypothetical protein A3D56_03400 [Candidatus Taylorbacteria bacterium RIFCSPHIGHO2_02_FULL_45_35]
MNKISISGNCVFPSGAHKATIVIDLRLGLIEDVRGYTTTADVVLTDCLLIFPGSVDIHIHNRESPCGKQNYKEDAETAGQAAMSGGVVATASMPNLPTPPTTRGLYLDVLALSEKCPITNIPYAAIAPGSRPFRLIGDQQVPFKGFLAESVNNLKFTSEKEADGTLCHYSDEDVSLHCDDNDILAVCKNELTHEKRRPAGSEEKAIRFAIAEHEKYRFGRLKIVHCSTAIGLAYIMGARFRGVKIFVEATHHHVFADESILTDENRTLWQMNPPLRSPNDREFILDALKHGEIDVLASDHAPHTKEEKALVEEEGKLLTKLNPGQKVLSGVPTLDTYGLFATWLIVKKGFSAERVAEITSENPGRWLNHFLPKTDENGRGFGKIEKGYIGSLTVLDFTPTTLTRQMLKTKCGWSPWEGYTFPGRVAYTIIRGGIHRSIGF